MLEFVGRIGVASLGGERKGVPLKKIDAVGHGPERVLKISTRLARVAVLHSGDGSKIEGVGGNAVIVLNLDFSKALIIGYVGYHDAVAQSGPVRIVLFGTGGGLDRYFVVGGGIWRIAARQVLNT